MPLHCVGMMQLADLTPPSAVASLWTGVGSWSIVDGGRGLVVLCAARVLGYTPQSSKPYSCPASRQRKSPETVTETSMVYWTGESYTKSPGSIPHLVRQTAGRTWQQSLVLAGEGGYRL